MNRLLVFLLLILLVPATAFCAIYGYVDDEGVYHMTNIRPPGKNYRVVIEDRESAAQAVPGCSTRMRMTASLSSIPRHTDSTPAW